MLSAIAINIVDVKTSWMTDSMPVHHSAQRGERAAPLTKRIGDLVSCRGLAATPRLQVTVKQRDKASTSRGIRIGLPLRKCRGFLVTIRRACAPKTRTGSLAKSFNRNSPRWIFNEHVCFPRPAHPNAVKAASALRSSHPAVNGGRDCAMALALTPHRQQSERYQSGVSQRRRLLKAVLRASLAVFRREP